ncbi:MAG: alcohol dehydrogenase family protein [Proteobacteria bacterium]|nr:alcohol dehydrogenase family protein [Pseudomonadota bacterium]
MAKDIPRFMKAVLLVGHGGLDKLDYRDDVPTPSPGPGEVLIAVGGAGMNNTDINTRTGWYAQENRDATAVDAEADTVKPWNRASLTFPRIQGADIAGRIVAVGDGIASARIGERVLVDAWICNPSDRLADPVYIGSERDGGYGEYVAVPAANAHRIESALSDAELATFPCAYTTAENMLHRSGLVAGETVMVTGASGGVGSALVRLAKRRGARVLAIAGAAKEAQVRKAGADLFLARDTEDLVDAVEALLGGDAVALAADVVGGPGFRTCIDVLRKGGRYVTAGAIAGPYVELDLRTLYLRDITLYGATVTDAEVFPNLVGYIERGEIRPLVERTYPLSRIRDAQRDFAAKTHVGKLVLIPGA